MSNHNPPTAREAMAFWHSCKGHTLDEIAEILGITRSSAAYAVRMAKAKARCQGLWFVYTKPPEPSLTKVGSGMTNLKQLAAEAGLIDTKNEYR